MKQEKFTIRQFNLRYKSDDACLDEIFQNRFGDLKVCPKCERETTFYKVTDRKCYACQFCGHQLYPLADTIFHKSDTSLRLWFYAIYLFSTSKNGVSGKELQRQLGVTYKTAWRIAKQIRLLFSHAGGILKDTVEVDETYVGGKGRNNKRGRGAENKTPVFGMLKRNGDVRAKVTVDTKRKTVMPIIRENIQIGSEIMSDEYRPYHSLRNEGYKHESVRHGVKEYVRGKVHTNSIEGFWSQLKRSIDGTYHAVSPKYLQAYVNEFAYRYNRRFSALSLFSLMIELAGKPLQ